MIPLAGFTTRSLLRWSGEEEEKWGDSYVEERTQRRKTHPGVEETDRRHHQETRTHRGTGSHQSSERTTTTATSTEAGHTAGKNCQKRTIPMTVPR